MARGTPFARRLQKETCGNFRNIILYYLVLVWVALGLPEILGFGFSEFRDVTARPRPPQSYSYTELLPVLEALTGLDAEQNALTVL